MKFDQLTKKKLKKFWSNAQINRNFRSTENVKWNSIKWSFPCKMTCYLFFFIHLKQSTKKSFVIFLSCSTTIAIIQSCSPTSSLCRPASSSPSSQSSTSNPTSRRRKSWRSIVFIQSVMIFHGVLIILIRMAKMKFGLIWKYYYECHLNSIEAFFVSTNL